MDARILDVLTGAASLLVFIVLLIALPKVMDNTGIAYIVALVLFLITMSGAGYVINEKIS